MKRPSTYVLLNPHEIGVPRVLARGTRGAPPVQLPVRLCSAGRANTIVAVVNEETANNYFDAMPGCGRIGGIDSVLLA